MIDRIAILGGSSVYVPEFLFSIITHNINVRELVLYGRPGDKLPVVANFCRRIVKRTGFPTTILHTSNLAEAVTNARYVINHVRVGGMAARLRDETLPPADGMIGDESVGPGGLTNALRTLPTVFEQAAAVQEANPSAIYINLTNPMGILVDALNAHTKLRVIGVCDLPGTCIRKIAAFLRVPYTDLDVDYIGLNHLGWIQDVKIRRRSVMSSLLERLERESAFDGELIRLFRMIPTRTPDLYFHADRVLADQKRAGKHRAQSLHEAESQILALYRDEHLSEIPALTRARNTPWYEETIIPLIQALEGQEKQHLILCVRNDGAIRDLPADCSVELPVEVGNGAFKPRRVGASPKFLHGMFAAAKESERLIVEAAYHKSYDYALQAFAVSPFVHSLDVAKRYLDRFIREERIELH